MFIWHKKLRRWMIPGGHVEPNESPADAALREVTEETGHHIQLLQPPTARIVHNLYDCIMVPTPWWIVEEEVPPSRREGPHTHVDHLYLALSRNDIRQDAGSESRCRWVSIDVIPELNTFRGTAVLALKAARTFADLADGAEADGRYRSVRRI
jgi:8-oxo-dGTP pyrophosphatase MutT (NUDIX family)